MNVNDYTQIKQQPRSKKVSESLRNNKISEFEMNYKDFKANKNNDQFQYFDTNEPSREFLSTNQNEILGSQSSEENVSIEHENIELGY